MRIGRVEIHRQFILDQMVDDEVADKLSGIMVRDPLSGNPGRRLIFNQSEQGYIPLAGDPDGQAAWLVDRKLYGMYSLELYLETDGMARTTMTFDLNQLDYYQMRAFYRPIVLHVESWYHQVNPTVTLRIDEFWHEDDEPVVVAELVTPKDHMCDEFLTMKFPFPDLCAREVHYGFSLGKLYARSILELG